MPQVAAGFPAGDAVFQASRDGSPRFGAYHKTKSRA
jgi:hypothetical protein